VVLRTFGNDADEILPFSLRLWASRGVNGVPSYKMIHSWTGVPILSSQASGLEWHQPSTIHHQLSFIGWPLCRTIGNPGTRTKKPVLRQTLLFGRERRGGGLFRRQRSRRVRPEDCELVNVVRPLSVKDGSALSVRDCLQSGSVVRVDRFRAMTSPTISSIVSTLKDPFSILLHTLSQTGNKIALKKNHSNFPFQIPFQKIIRHFF